MRLLQQLTHYQMMFEKHKQQTTLSQQGRRISSMDSYDFWMVGSLFLIISPMLIFDLMKKIINTFLILSFVSLSSCKTVQNKADEVIQKEDKYLMKFLNKKKTC